MIYQKCPKKADGNSRMFYDESIVMSGISCLGFGGYLGIVLHRAKLGRVWPGMLETPVTHFLLRLLPQVLIPVPIAGLLLLPLAQTHISV
jgi:hypothetical protein